MRLVLDTDVVVAAMRSPGGASTALLAMARAGYVQLVMSVALALEYEATCRRPEHRRAAGLDDADLAAFLDALIALGEPATSYYLWRPRLKDPDDEMVLEAAVNGRAEAIVTFNRRDFGSAPQQFGIAVMSPSEALRRLRI